MVEDSWGNKAGRLPCSSGAAPVASSGEGLERTQGHFRCSVGYRGTEVLEPGVGHKNTKFLCVHVRSGEFFKIEL